MSTQTVIFFVLIFATVLGGFLVKRLAEFLYEKSSEKHWLRKTIYLSVSKSAVITALGLALGYAVAGSHLIDELDGPVNLFTFTFQGALVLTSAILIRIGVGIFFFHAADILGYWLDSRSKKTKNKIDDMLTTILVRVARVLVVSVTILEIAHVLTGSEIKTILAGLGIGGLAVALAAQDTLKNIFGAVVIFMEKPFNLGDRIIFGDHDGTIESVGLRSCRMRRLDGHLVTIPNGSLSGAVIHNVAKRPFIRRIFNISITYDTPPAKIREAKEILEEILEKHEGMAEDFPPRVYFNEFKAYSLDFLCIYWYHPPAYWDFLAFTEKVNTEIVEGFNQAGIEFAFPTQSIYMKDVGDNLSIPDPTS